MLPLEWKYPADLLAERKSVIETGDLRARIRFDVEGRAPYAWGLLTAADLAKWFGYCRISVIEFGVADGGGLLELCRLTQLVSEETRVSIDVIGFDNGLGLPPPSDFRDHPEIWARGDFAMASERDLRARLPSNCQLIMGDIGDTVSNFIVGHSVEAPIAFCSFDVDLYSSTRSALDIYSGSADHYLPVGVAYFDDTIGSATSFGSLCRNKKAGQLLALDEFNVHNNARVIDNIRALKYRRPLSNEQWMDQVYGVHVLDSPLRNMERRSVAATMEDHSQRLRWPI